MKTCTPPLTQRQRVSLSLFARRSQTPILPPAPRKTDYILNILYVSQVHLCLFVCCLWSCLCARPCNAMRGFRCVCCVYAGVRLASADWGTWILHTECVNSGWTPGCTVSGTLWQPRPNDPARDCTVHGEVLCSRTATPSSHSHLSPSPFSPHPLSVPPAPSFTSLLCPPSPLNFFSISPFMLCFFTTPPAFPSLSICITLLSTRQKLSAGIWERRVLQTCQWRQMLFKYQTLKRPYQPCGMSSYRG